jgi:ABC-type multidrug transport system fused ATPase/permease subunit
MLKKITGIFDLVEKKNKPQMFIIFIMMIFAMCLEAIGIGLIYPLIIFLVEKDFSNNEFLANLKNYFPNQDYNDFIIIFLIIIVTIYLLKNLFLALLNYVSSKFIYNFQANLSNKLLNLYTSQDYIFFKDKNSSEFIRNIINESNMISFKIFTPTVVFFSEILTIIGISFFLFSVEFLGTLIFFVIFVSFSWLFNRLIKKKISSWGNKRQIYEGNRIKKLQEIFGSIKQIKFYNLKNNFNNIFFNINLKYASVTSNQAYTESLPKLIIEIIAIFSVSCFIFFLNITSNNNTELIAILGIFGAAALKILPSLNRVINSIQNINFSYPIINTYKKNFKKLLKKNYNKRYKKIIFSISSGIKLKNIKFKYKNKIIFNNLNLSIPSDSVTGIKGRSGLGKTTLIDLLLLLLLPNKGSIICGKNKIDLNPILWRELISYIPQENYILDDTVEKNIYFGVNESNINTITLEEALTLSDSKIFINSLNKRLNTNLGQNGSKLSGGQKQRIGIARGLIRGRPILILDESTSNLDSKTEGKILKRIINSKKFKIIILISHREEVLKFCDKVIDLNKLLS